MEEHYVQGEDPVECAVHGQPAAALPERLDKHLGSSRQAGLGQPAAALPEHLDKKLGSSRQAGRRAGGREGGREGGQAGGRAGGRAGGWTLSHPAVRQAVAGTQPSSGSAPFR